MSPSAIACAVGGSLILAEALLLKAMRRERTVWTELVFNLNSGHILMRAFRGVEIAVYAAVLAHLNLHWIDRLPHAAQWTFALFAWDLCFYWRIGRIQTPAGAVQMRYLSVRTLEQASRFTRKRPAGRCP